MSAILLSNLLPSIPNATATTTGSGGQPPLAALQRPILNNNGPNTTTDTLILDLSMRDLNAIHDHLWIAGSHGNISPLHHQRVLLRKIIPSEYARLHLVWFDRTIYIKPLPETILRNDYSRYYYSSEEEKGDKGLVVGFLRSYCRLIRFPIDLAIAKELHLISDEVEWDAWVSFREGILAKTNESDVNKRYEYGELRLNRLDIIYRLTFRGLTYFTVHRTYKTYFAQYFSLFATVFASLAIILTAMQVLVAVQDIPETVITTSYRFCVAVLVGVCLCIGYVIVVFFLMLLYNVVRAWLAHRQDKTSIYPEP